MATQNNRPNTGANQVNSELKNAAANLAGPALDMAQGASAFQAATNALKGAALDKLLGPTAIFAGGLVGILRTIKSVVKESGILERGLKRIASLQQIEGKFETLLKSAEAATKRIKELYRFTAQSPFDFSDVAEGNRILEALTAGALSGARGMKLVGDAAAGTGQDFASTADRVGKLYAALSSGRSLDKIMFQMQFTGLVTEELAAKLETLEQGGAGFTQMWAAVEQQLKRTEGGMQNEMKTLDALTTKLNEARKVMETAFATPFVEAQAKAIETSIKATQNLTPVLADIGRDLAVVSNFFTDLKNDITTSTFATKGFAGVLSVAAKTATAFIVALSSATVAAFVLNVGAAAKASLKFAEGLRLTFGAAMSTASAVEAIAAASKLSADASVAFASNNFLAAASLKAQALWLGVSTRATALHTASTAAASTATGFAAIRNYAAAMSLGVLSGAAKLAGTAFMFLGRAVGASVAAFATNIYLMAAAAIGAAVYATYKWAQSLDDVQKSYRGVTDAIDATNKKLEDQRKAIRTLDDWRKAVSDLSLELAKLNDELSAEVTSPEKKQERAVKEGQRRVLQAKQKSLGAVNLADLGPGQRERDFLINDVAEGRRTSEDAEQAAIDQADEVGQAARLRERAARKAQEAAQGAAVNSAQNAFERGGGKTVANNENEIASMGDLEARKKAAQDRLAKASAAPGVNASAAYGAAITGGRGGNPNSAGNADQLAELASAKGELEAINAEIVRKGELERQNADLRRSSESELVQLSQKISDIQAAGLPVSAEMLRRQAELVALSKAYADNERQAAADTRAAQQAERTVELKKVELFYDEAIASAKLRGEETAALESEKRLALLRKQLEQAQALGKELEAQQFSAQIADIEGDRAKFRRDKDVERQRNDKLIGRDRAGAQAIDDAEALRRKREEYQANGMTGGQADADFQQGILAEAASQQPRIVADSLQAIGGGGGFRESDPMAAAQKRIEALNVAMRDALVTIAENTKNSGMQ